MATLFAKINTQTEKWQHKICKIESKCGRQNNSPPEVFMSYSLVTCEYVTLDDKRNFAGVFKLRILRWGYYPGVSRWTQSNYKFF